jgi:hypothetical protein
MDMLGDAEPVELTDDGWADEAYVDIEQPPSAPLVSPEAWAVTSLTLSVASLLVTTLAQYASFLLLSQLQDDSGRRQIMVVVLPTGVVALCGVLAGLVAWRRRARLPGWAGAVGTAGVVLGGLVVLLVASALIAAWVVDPQNGQSF